MKKNTKDIFLEYRTKMIFDFYKDDNNLIDTKTSVRKFPKSVGSEIHRIKNTLMKAGLIITYKL